MTTVNEEKGRRRTEDATTFFDHHPKYDWSKEAQSGANRSEIALGANGDRGEAAAASQGPVSAQLNHTDPNKL